MKTNVKNSILIIVFAVGLFAAITIFYVSKSPCFRAAEKKVGTLSSQQAAEKAINYINQNLLQKGASASLINVVEENGLYKFSFKIGDKEFKSFVTKDGKILFPEEGIDLEKPLAIQPETQEEKTLTIGNFSVSNDEICKENGKPIVYFFGSKGCPHCLWQHPIVEKIAKHFEGYISFHNNMDSDADKDVFSKYSPGSIPTLVLGCKYYRVGSGEREGEEKESKALTALICKLTENKSTEICNKVQDLIDQIEQ